MGSKETDILLIDRFLNNELSEPEREYFIQRLELEPPLKTLLQDEKILRHGIEYSSIKQMAKQLTALEESLARGPIEVSQKRDSIWTTNIFKIAASVIFLISVSIFIFLLTSDGDPDEIFAQNFSPYPNTFYNPTRRDTALETETSKAFHEYDAGNYKQALLHFQNITGSQKDDAIEFYQANALLASELTKEAQSKLETLSFKKESAFYYPAKWYLCLCYLKNGQLVKAKEILKELKTSNNSFQQKASELFEEIKSI